jgi:hypothetical protein
MGCLDRLDSRPGSPPPWHPHGLRILHSPGLPQRWMYRKPADMGGNRPHQNVQTSVFTKRYISDNCGDTEGTMRYIDHVAVKYERNNETMKTFCL